MKILAQFESIMDFLSVTKRDISDNQVSSLNRKDRRKYKKLKDLFNINVPEIINIINNTVGDKSLIMDYVLINKDMKIIDRPYNLIFNHCTRRYEPCLVILFAIVLVNGIKYPINFDFWICKDMIGTDDYLTKNEIAKNMLKCLLDNGLKIDRILFDAGFTSEVLINFINEQKIPFTCRIAKTKKFIYRKKKYTPKELFKNVKNASFYFYKKVGYMSKKFVKYFDVKSTLVVVANTRNKLIDRDFYCLISTESKTYTEIFRIYKTRFHIESFFRNMKSYIGLTSFNTHNQDKIDNHISLCCISYIFVELFSKKIKMTFFQTLMYIQTLSKSILERKLYPIFKSIKNIFNEKSTFQTLNNPILKYLRAF